MSAPAFNPAAPCDSSVAVPAKPHKAVRRDDRFYDFGEFESFAGPNTSESEFISTIYDLLKAGVDVYAVVDRSGKFDRPTGQWINRDGSKITRAELLAKFGQQ
jgi:hypothetical protein